MLDVEYTVTEHNSEGQMDEIFDRWQLVGKKKYLSSDLFGWKEGDNIPYLR